MKHLNFSSKLFAFLFVISSMMYVGCQKEDQKNNLENKSNLSLENRVSLDRPVLNGDILQFRDYSHFKSYLETLNNLLSDESNEFEEQVLNTSDFQSVYKKLANDEFVDPINRYKPFLTDPAVMAVVNEHYEVRIDDVLITYINNSQVLRSSFDNSTARNAIRSIPKGQELTLSDVPSGAAWGEDTEEQSFLGPWCGCEIKIKRLNCSTLRIIGNCQDFVFGAGDGTVEIFINNSQFFPPVGAIPSSTFRVNGNFMFDIPMSNLSTLFLHASARPDCIRRNLVTASLQGNAGPQCDPDDKDTGWLWTQNAAGTEGISHRTSAYKNSWSAYQRAEIFSRRWNGSSWVKNKSNLRVNISATRKGFGCGVIDTESETKTCNSCDNRAASVNVGLFGTSRIHHCDGDVVGTFRKIIGSTTINATGSPDFECCE